MATVEVTGSVKDIMDMSMDGREIGLEFRLNDINVQTSAGTVGRINPTAPARASINPTSGFFTAPLEPTTVMLFDAWYTLTAFWVDTGGPAMDFPGWQIRVPAGGGAINNMITLGPQGGGWGGPIANLSLVLISLTKPDNLQVGQLWLKASPENHDSPNPDLNSGELYRGIA